MKNKIIILITAILLCVNSKAQSEFNQIDDNGNITSSEQRKSINDSLSSSHKEIPTGIRAWTVDNRFGDRASAVVDTLSYMFMNSIFTTGLRGEYNTLGNLGSPRINRIFINQDLYSGQFIFTQPYSFFITPINKFHFTNTLSPLTVLAYNTSGNSTYGEDHLTANFAVNANKRLGAGFKFDYDYGRGYYQNQSTALFNYSMYGSYLGDRYRAHVLFSTNHMKMAENGGITNDNYITHPEIFNESYSENEIPTVLSNNWNRNDNQHIFLTHQYNVGFYRKVKMTDEEIKARRFAIESKKDNDKKDDNDKNTQNSNTTLKGRPENAKILGNEPIQKDNKNERIVITDKQTRDSLLRVEQKVEEDTTWLKKEYVPVTSFIHSLQVDNYRRIYQAYSTPTDYYTNTYNNVGELSGDSIYDKTRHYEVKNTFAIALLEGFNKWAKAGVKGFITSSLRHFTLPDSTKSIDTYNEHNISIGAQISKKMGQTLHYDATFETWLVGKDAGSLSLDANINLKFPLFRDTVRLDASGFFKRITPSFYYRHYHSRHYWWDNDDLSIPIHTRLQGRLSYNKTKTVLTIAVDNINNYTYFAQSYNITNTYSRTNNNVEVLQNNSPINILTLALSQNFKFGPLHWESVLTYQKTSDKVILPLPTFNVYTNLFLRFKIAKVLHCDLGADARYFTKYYAPDYSPGLGSYTIQANDNKVEIGNYPMVNVYANFLLKHTRFFVLMSHVNSGSGNKAYFYVPHYPQNGSTIRFGLSWNFFN